MFYELTNIISSIIISSMLFFNVVDVFFFFLLRITKIFLGSFFGNNKTVAGNEM